MDESSTPALSCRECGTEIFRKRAAGRPPELCEPCRPIVRLRNGMLAQRRAAAGIKPRTTVECADCGAVEARRSFSGPVALRCAACLKRRHLEAGARTFEKAQERREKEFQLTGQWSLCKDCGTGVQLSRYGPRARRCRSCDLAARRAREYTIKPDYSLKICIDCGTSMQIYKTATGTKRCKPCGAVWRRQRERQWTATNPTRQRARWRRYTHVRRSLIRNQTAERFDPIEIFDRDRWTCGICRKRISKKLEWPHPRCASIDHVVPIVEGGPHSRANVRATHLQCNLRKSCYGGGEQLALVG